MNKKNIFKILISLWIFLPDGAFSKELTPISKYFSNRSLSDKNIQFLVGSSILNPPHSFKNSLGQNWIYQISYRIEKVRQYKIPIALKTQFITNRSNRLRSIAFSPGVRFPGTHRKTPLYIGLDFGSRFLIRDISQFKFYIQLSMIFRVVQIHKKVSALIEMNARYDIENPQFWRSPSSIFLMTGIDVNI